MVLITGSSRGIGKEIAKKFARENYKIVINGVSRKEDLENTVKEIKELVKNKEDVIGIMCDVSNYEEVEKMFLEIEEKLGQVDILINNAGISYVGLFNKMKMEEWDKIININVKGVINCTHRCSQNMIKNRAGKIVNISSIWGEVGASCEVIYSATKGAINAFTKGLGKELGSNNIRVNGVSCGIIDTEMNEFLTKEEVSAFVEDIGMMRMGKGEIGRAHV